MRTLSLLLFTAAISSGCGTTPRYNDSFGYFNPTPVLEHDKYLAVDAAKRLTALLPPATTKLQLRQPPKDTFGQSLIELLRSKGFALHEGKSEELAEKGASTPDSTPLNYVIDFMDTHAMYRVTVQVGGQTLSRAYQPKGKLIQPAGDWIRRE